MTKAFKMTDRKSNAINPIVYQETVGEVISELNSKHKVSLKNNHSLVNRVYKRYPVLSKAECSLIILYFFAIMRDLLIQQKVLKLGGFLNVFKLEALDRKTKRHTLPIINLLPRIETFANSLKKIAKKDELRKLLHKP